MTPQPGRSLSVNRQPGTNIILVKGEVPSNGVRTYVTVHDPSLYAGTVLAELTAAGGIKMSGEVKRDVTIRKQDPSAQAAAGKWTIVGVHETPLSAVITRMNKDSVNLYAEALCKRMGFDAAKGASGNWQNGGAATAAYLKSVGIPETDFTLADGCGLSRKNEISPRALVRVLCSEFYGKNREAYIASLSVAGVDGTLDDRFRGSDLRKRVFGKSGFIEGVSAVTGYLQAKDGQWYAFAVMVNGIPRLSNGEVKLLQERIVKAVDAEVAPKK
jgi:serine-type D-Ala-D-Ala carboxypeptidase/endopeptidase (penicillin-binding protein 4)